LVPLALIGLATAGQLAPYFPACLFYQKTGLLCPGCGATRAAIALSRGDLGEALRDNLFFVAAVLGGGTWVVLASLRERFPQACFLRLFRFRLTFLWVTLAALAGFWLLRNLPDIEWLRPR